jgi:hypothetical protein
MLYLHYKYNKANKVMILNEEHRDFKRLFWRSNKGQIKEILSTVNEKYLRGLFHRLQRNPQGKNGSRIYCRYSGYQFQVSPKTITDELKRRGK